jgi:thiosulfate/3-mercaptopyruvate sulfurtransferase
MTNFETIIQADELLTILDDPDLAIFDCRFSLKDPAQGRREYQKGHLPGAVYLDLDRDLSGKIIPGETGRHPFPEAGEFAARLSSWGVGPETQVVAYDDLTGAIAARLWGLLRWLGHKKAAVLSGGWSKWLSKDYPTTTQISLPSPREFRANPQGDFLMSAAEVEELLGRDDFLIVDSRSENRYRGIEEPIDAIAGHIPGAVSHPYEGNLDDDGYFLNTEQLRTRFEKAFYDHPADQMVFYCGSGVTSIHNLIAMIQIGKALPKLYPGSWSDWILKPERGIEKDN